VNDYSTISIDKIKNKKGRYINSRAINQTHLLEPINLDSTNLN